MPISKEVWQVECTQRAFTQFAKQGLSAQDKIVLVSDAWTRKLSVWDELLQALDEAKRATMVITVRPFANTSDVRDLSQVLQYSRATAVWAVGSYATLLVAKAAAQEVSRAWRQDALMHLVPYRAPQVDFIESPLAQGLYTGGMPWTWVPDPVDAGHVPQEGEFYATRTVVDPLVFGQLPEPVLRGAILESALCALDMWESDPSVQALWDALPDWFAKREYTHVATLLLDIAKDYHAKPFAPSVAVHWALALRARVTPPEIAAFTCLGALARRKSLSEKFTWEALELFLYESLPHARLHLSKPLEIWDFTEATQDAARMLHGAYAYEDLYSMSQGVWNALSPYETSSVPYYSLP